MFFFNLVIRVLMLGLIFVKLGILENRLLLSARMEWLMKMFVLGMVKRSWLIR